MIIVTELHELDRVFQKMMISWDFHHLHRMVVKTKDILLAEDLKDETP